MDFHFVQKIPSQMDCIVANTDLKIFFYSIVEIQEQYKCFN